MLKKSLAFIISLTLIFAVFCGTVVKANDLSTYFEAPNNFVVKTDELTLNNLTESFNFAKQKGTGLKLALNNTVVSFSATFVLNNEVEVNSLSISDITTPSQQEINLKAYSVSGVKNGLLKSDSNGIVEITLPFNSQNGTPLAVNLNENGEFNVLYTKYNSFEKNVTIRTDYFGTFIIADAVFDGSNLTSCNLKGAKITLTQSVMIAESFGAVCEDVL